MTLLLTWFLVMLRWVATFQRNNIFDKSESWLTAHLLALIWGFNRSCFQTFSWERKVFFSATFPSKISGKLNSRASGRVWWRKHCSALRNCHHVLLKPNVPNICMSSCLKTAQVSQSLSAVEVSPGDDWANFINSLDGDGEMWIKAQIFFSNKQWADIKKAELLLWNLHLTRRSPVSLGAGALFHLQGTFITRGVGNSDVHPDVWDAI